MNRRVAVRGISILNGKLLCVRLKPYEGALSTSGDKVWWCLPGGGLESSEPLVRGVRREFVEETGIEPNVGDLLYIQQFSTPDTDTEHLEFFFHITNPEAYLNVDLSKASHGFTEIAEIAYVDTKVTNVLPAFLKTENIKGRIIRKNNPKIFNFL